MLQRSEPWLILDRDDPNNPEWIVAVAVHRCPAEFPADLDREDGLAPGTRWLGRFHANHFSWLQWLFGRAMMLRMTGRGHECFATRITEKNPIWTSYTYHDCDAIHDGA